jgi:AraC-like DNA-binding protein
MDVLSLRHIPAPPLDKFIEYLWLFVSPPRAFVKERMMPSGSATLVINLLEDEVRNYTGDDLQIVHRLPGSALTAAQSRSFVIDTIEQIDVMGVEFHPGGAWPFFGAAADELANQHVALKDLWGGSAESLRAQLLAAPTPREKFWILERALTRLAARPIQIDECVAHAVRALSQSPQVQTIAALGQRMSISARKFSRLFTQQVGLKPKTFARVQRFNRVLAQIGLGREIDWASVVAQCGYYDQAHFIHDFRAFSGFIPTEYVERNKVHIRHVPLS